jgi:hypothetical protein
MKNCSTYWVGIGTAPVWVIRAAVQVRVQSVRSLRPDCGTTPPIGWVDVGRPIPGHQDPVHM